MFLPPRRTPLKPGLKSPLSTALISALLFSFPASAAIAFDAATNGGNTSTGTLSFTHTMGATGLLTVCFLGDAIPGNDDITGVTYNAVSMTLAGKYTGATSNSNRYTYWYILPTAASGAHTLTITASHAHYIGAISTSYTGTATSGQPDNFHVFPTSTSNGYTTSLATVSNDAWMLICSGAVQNNCNAGGGPTCTQRVQGEPNDEPMLADSNAAITPGGATVTMTIARQAILSDGIQMMMSIACNGCPGNPVIHHKVSGN